MRIWIGLALLALSGCTQLGAKIKHVILLMEENRSFDHMFGFYKSRGRGGKVDGLRGDEWNAWNTSQPDGRRKVVDGNSRYIGLIDPNHGVPASTRKIFGDDCLRRQCTNVSMSGFVEYESKTRDPESVMQMFTPDRVPVISALADEFLLFDRWFCSVPGPTWPNRIFTLLGTSEGDTSTSHWNNETFLYFGKTVFDLAEEAGLDWRFYYADAPLEMAMIAKLTFNPQKIAGWEQFKKDIRTGQLPAFSWVNPRWFINVTTGEGSNDQHPDHDVRLGEALMKELYEELRVSPAWNETLFIITYDEHGGFYDHVPTPVGVPEPDNSTSFPDVFDFKRLGIRVPTLLVSPWVAKGTVVNRVPGPTPNSEFDHTSIIATLRKMWGIDKPLTKRDAWASTFESFLSEPEPRTNCPITLPAAPSRLGVEEAEAEAAAPLNDLQRDIIAQFVKLRGTQAGLTQAHALPSRQGEAGAWMEQLVRDVMEGNHVYAAGNEVPVAVSRRRS